MGTISQIPSQAGTPTSSSLFDKLVESQQRLSRWFDTLLPDDYGIDGCADFAHRFAISHLRYGDTVWDVGGGRYPFISHRLKQELNLTIMGLDIDPGELAAAPAGIYDRTVCADLMKYAGTGDADVVICQSLLEHVSNVEAALAAIKTMLRPDGRALIFMPSRYAVYTWLNLIIPHELKTRMLRVLVHRGKPFKAFPAFYDRCTPREIRELAAKWGLTVEEQRTYFASTYFAFFFPFHLIWRAWLLCFRTVAGDQAAETFAMLLRKTR
jgi:2-polyprenyl-3-methyl-5-hydroxy-6-metoxy-1,4-benzoquinol methylase